jgi:hypothetical protein
MDVVVDVLGSKFVVLLVVVAVVDAAVLLVEGIGVAIEEFVVGKDVMFAVVINSMIPNSGIRMISSPGILVTAASGVVVFMVVVFDEVG